MDALTSLLAARELLREITPLTFDCGTLCGAACCKNDTDAEEEQGMLLFPREEELYADNPDFCRILPSGLLHMGKPVLLMTCTGRCPRERRPLACRICPLTPYVKNDRCGTVMDIRATMCPLLRSGKTGLSPAFVEAVDQASEILWADPTHRAFLRMYSRHLEEYRYLQKKMGL